MCPGYVRVRDNAARRPILTGHHKKRARAHEAVECDSPPTYTTQSLPAVATFPAFPAGPGLSVVVSRCGTGTGTTTSRPERTNREPQPPHTTSAPHVSRRGHLKTPVPVPRPPASALRCPREKKKNVHHHHHRPPRQLRACACTGATEPASLLLLLLVGMGAAAVDGAASASMRAAVSRLSFGAAAEERRDAAGEVARLARADERTKRLLPELGVVPPLLDMLADADARGAAGARVAAAGALLELARGTHRLVDRSVTSTSPCLLYLPACLGVLSSRFFSRATSLINVPCYYWN